MVRFIKSRRLDWLGHVRQMDDDRTAIRVADRKSIDRRIGGRPRKRWVGDGEDVLRCMNIRSRRRLCGEMTEWRKMNWP